MGALASALASLALTAAAVALTGDRSFSVGRAANLCVQLGFLAGPIAVTFGFVLRGHVTALVADRAPVGRIVVDAHKYGLSLAGVVLGLYLVVAWLMSTAGLCALRPLIPRAFAIAAAAGTGLAWGALWHLPEPEEAA